MDKFSHQERLYSLTREIGASPVYDDDVVFAAAWMHDLGVFIGHRPEDLAALANWDMIAFAVERVPGLLKEFCFPAGKMSAVIEVIRVHQPNGDPKTLEGVIVRDADILEQLGAAGILRTVCKIGRDTRFHIFPDALRVLRTGPLMTRFSTFNPPVLVLGKIIHRRGRRFFSISRHRCSAQIRERIPSGGVLAQ